MMLKNIFSQITDFLDEYWIPMVIVLSLSGCFAILYLLSIAIRNEQIEWEKFSSEHNCRVITQHPGETFTTFGVSSNGQAVIGVGSTSAKEGWLCDNGITYYRNAR